MYTAVCITWTYDNGMEHIFITGIREEFCAMIKDMINRSVFTKSLFYHICPWMFVWTIFNTHFEFF